MNYNSIKNNSKFFNRIKEEKDVYFDKPYTYKIENLNCDNPHNLLFYDQYVDACRIVNSIGKVFSDTEYIDDDFGYCKKKFDCNHTMFSHENCGFENEVNNLVPFMGSRGSGKSSIMESFLQYLKKYNARQNKHHEEFDLGNKRFITLETIDAGHLSNKEDIFGVVLARLLAYYNDELDKSHYKSEEQYDCERRSILTEFSNLFNSVSKLKNSSTFYENIDGKNALVTLRDLDRTQELKKQFKNLLKKFVNIFKCNDNCNQSNQEEIYFVISIDDLDMCMNNCYSMLEQIQSYMMIPNLIIMIATDYETILSHCQNYFFNCFDKLINTKPDLNTTYQRDSKIYLCLNIAKEYLNKIFPQSKIIYIPEGSHFNIMLSLLYDKNQDGNIYKAFCGSFKYNYNKRKKYNKVSFNKAIIAKIANATNFYFYPVSDDEHLYFVPTNLRLMAHYIHKIKLIKRDEKNRNKNILNKRYFDDIYRNIDFLFDDFTNRYRDILGEISLNFVNQIVEAYYSEYYSIDGLIDNLMAYYYNNKIKIFDKYHRYNNLTLNNFFEVIINISNLAGYRKYTQFMSAVISLPLHRNVIHALVNSGFKNNTAKTYYEYARSCYGDIAFGKTINSILPKAFIGIYRNKLPGVNVDTDRSSTLFLNIGYIDNINISDILDDFLSYILTNEYIDEGFSENEIADYILVIISILIFTSALEYKFKIIGLGDRDENISVILDGEQHASFGLFAIFENVCRLTELLNEFFSCLEMYRTDDRIEKIYCVLEEKLRQIRKINTYDHSEFKTCYLPILNMNIMFNMFEKVGGQINSKKYSSSIFDIYIDFINVFTNEFETIATYYSDVKIEDSVFDIENSVILLNKVKGLFENGGIFDFNEKQKKLFHHIAGRIFEQNDENQTWNR